MGDWEYPFGDGRDGEGETPREREHEGQKGAAAGGTGGC